MSNTGVETSFQAGWYDCLYILKNQETDEYHGAFFQEDQPPNNCIDDSYTFNVRLLCRFITKGHKTKQEPLKAIETVQKALSIPDENVFIEEDIPWNGKHKLILVRPKWKQEQTYEPDFSNQTPTKD